MATVPKRQLLTYLQQRANNNWLIGHSSRQLYQLTEALFQQLSQSSTPPKILLADPDPIRFLASFLAAVAADCPIFLSNFDWGQQEWQQVLHLAQPDLIWAPHPLSSASHPRSSACIRGSIFIPTGGSSGQIRFAIHTWETLTASVNGFHHYFNRFPINSYCILPLHHVSGLMQFMRSLLTGGKLLIQPYSTLKAGVKGNIEPNQFFISLVPTQLQFLLKSAPNWLSHFHTILLGGAPAWPSLLNTARSHNIRLAPTYGMTETASQIVTLKPEDFLKGNNSSGQVLPHAQISICSETGTLLGTHQTGIITIKAESLCLGYYPEPNRDASANHQSGTLQTDDLGYIDNDGYLTIVGRRSNKIITGGENVFPVEVEAAILATGLVTDVCVIGLPHSIWGQAVTAVCVPCLNTTVATMQNALEKQLSKFKQPKHWVFVETLPRNAQGKVNYQQVQQLAQGGIRGE